MGLGELVICKCERRIAFDCLIQQANSLGQAFACRGTKGRSRDECFGPYVQIVSNKVSRWFLLDGRFFLGRELGFELRDDLFG